MKILITGGAGFIGSHTVQTALTAGHSVRVLDNLSTGLRTNVPGEVEFIEGDVNDATAVATAIDGCGAVLHLAALVSVPQSMREPIATFHINTNGAVTLLEAARQTGVRRFVLASTCAVYGDIPGCKDETSPVQPLSPYAASKLAAEAWVQVHARAYAMETVVLRYFNVYGPRQRADSPYSGVIARWCGAAATGKPCTVFGDGEQTRDFVAVQDVAAANMMALTAGLPWGEIFNVASGCSTSLNSLLEALGTVYGAAIQRTYEPPRAGDLLHSAGSSQRLQTYGWKPQVDLVSGLRTTVEN